MGYYTDIALTKTQIASTAAALRMTTSHTQEGRSAIRQLARTLEETLGRLGRQLTDLEQVQDELEKL